MNKRLKAEYINLPSIKDVRGSLTFAESTNHIPFDIKRIYYLHGVPEGGARGGHAHKNLTQAIFALSGSFRLTLDNGVSKGKFVLDDPTKGILIRNNVWRELDCFSPNTVCLVFASEYFSESDYIRDYQIFQNLVCDK